MSFKSNFMYIGNDYGYNKKNFNLIEKFDNIQSQNLKVKNEPIKKENIIRENIKIKTETNKKEINDFPLAWTCYRNNEGGWTCPMRGDK